jgi:hypothetical protein
MKAALAQRPDGKRFSHQRRIPGAALEASHRRLMNVISTLESAASFGELFQIVEDAIGDIPQIGELTIYDTALRIAAWRHLEPEEVYLHAGTRCGAQALGLNVRRTFAALTEFPPELLRLRAQEIEDVLCIYKDVLAGTRAIPRVRSPKYVALFL